MAGRPGRVGFDSLAATSVLGGRLHEFAGKSVLLRNSDQFFAGRALVELDGVARRIVLCPQGLDPSHVAPIAKIAEVDAIVSDLSEDAELLPERPHVAPSAPQPSTGAPAARVDTEWVLTTSGTTGVPKLAVHRLASLSAPIRRAAGPDEPIVWGTFYDIRRYGGLQIFLRALLGGHSLILSGYSEPIADFLRRLADEGATHVSGTPSHWRSVLMSPAAARLNPRYVRLSGEIADQAILDALKAFYPRANVSHAYASTEAGVGFEVKDGKAGFPASLIETGGSVDMRVVGGSLHLRSAAAASHYLDGSRPIADDEAFVDSGDMVERRADRYYFVGRHGGIINVGGLKVHPEEVEAVINEQPGVRLSLVRAQRNPLSGAIVVADIVATDDAAATDLESRVLQACGKALARHKVPVLIRRVPSLEVGANGKLVRRYG